MKILCHDYHGGRHYIDESMLVERISAYAVVIKGQSVLLVRDSSSGRWEFPGGGIESTEDIETGLKREFKEETGMELVVAGDLITDWTEYFYDLPTKQAWRARRQFYAGTAIQGNLRAGGNNDDVQAAQFINKSELKNLNTQANITGVIDKVLVD